MDYTLLFIFSMIVGLFFGALVATIVFHGKTASGTLKIDHSNPEKDQYLFVIDGELDQLSRKAKIVLKVDNDADLSQK